MSVSFVAGKEVTSCRKKKILNLKRRDASVRVTVTCCHDDMVIVTLATEIMELDGLLKFLSRTVVDLT